MLNTPSAANGGILLANPINQEHPLNKGRLFWYRALPGWMSGPTWHDLCGKYNGTLESTPTWAALAYPGGIGSIKLNGTSQYAKSGNTTITGSGGHSMFAWVFPTSDSFGVQAICSIGSYNDSNYTIGMGYDNSLGNGNPGTLAFLNQGTTTYTSSGLSLTENKWNFVGYMLNSSGITFFVNGKTAFVSGSTQTATSENPILLGATSSGGMTFGYWPGYLDDVSMWNRMLSVSEAYRLYDLSQRAYPGVLNRTNNIVYSFVSSPPTPNFTFNQGTSASGTGSGSIYPYLATTVGLNDLIVVEIGAYVPGVTLTGFTVTDNSANTYNLVSAVENSQDAWLYTFYAVNNLAKGALSITITPQGSNLTNLATSVAVLDYSTLNNAPAVLDTYGTTTGLSTTPTGPTLTGKQSGELLVGALATGGDPISITYGSGFTGRNSGGGGVSMTLYTEDITDTSSTTPPQVTATFGNSVYWAVGSALFNLPTTLSAGYGSFGLTGESTTSTPAIKASSGSFAMTGEPTTDAAGGTFSLAGEAATFTTQMNAAYSTFSLTGEDATLQELVWTVLTATYGTFSLTGESTTPTPEIDAADGTFSLTGEPASLSHTWVMSAAYGTFSLSGSSSPPTPEIVGSDGAFSLTGEPATLLVQLSAAYGTYTLTGEPAFLNGPVGTGYFTLTGQPVNFAIRLPTPNGVWRVARSKIWTVDH